MLFYLFTYRPNQHTPKPKTVSKVDFLFNCDLVILVELVSHRLSSMIEYSDTVPRHINVDLALFQTYIRYPLILIPHNILHSIFFIVIGGQVILLNNIRDLLIRQRP
jgi:hypothetical protein